MRLLFGIRTSEPLTLSVTASGPLPPQPPDLQLKTQGQDTTIDCNNGTWVAPLEAGDHVVYMPAPGDGWIDARLEFTLSAPATIVSSDGASGTLKTWTAATGASDPKNPGPPPISSAVPLPPDSTWIGRTIVAMSTQVSDARSAPHQPSTSTPEQGPFR